MFCSVECFLCDVWQNYIWESMYLGKQYLLKVINLVSTSPVLGLYIKYVR